jgi:hypothetical protein
VRVRTTHAIGEMPTFSLLAGSGIWACGTYIVGCGSRLSPPSRTSLADADDLPRLLAHEFAHPDACRNGR